LVRRPLHAPTTAARWTTPDGDFLDLHRLAGSTGSTGSSNAPRVLILHGLEGSLHSHYAQGLLHECQRRGWAADLLLWRSCGTDPNITRRFYHSGETSDVTFVIDRLVAEHPTQMLGVVGVSLGGNVLLKYLGERRENLPSQLRAAAAVSVPFDLSQGARYIDRGFSKIYQRYFLKTLRRKAQEKLGRYPDLIPSPNRISTLETLVDFDDVLTAPLHGFRDAEDYYAQSSSIHFLREISIKTLLLNAIDDPFLPPAVLDRVATIVKENPNIVADFPAHGGHAGFVGGMNPLRPMYYIEQRVGDFFAEHLR